MMKSFHDFDLIDFNSYRIRAVAERAYFPETLEDIARLFSDTVRPKVIIGGGCNVIFSKCCYPGIDFVIFDHHFAAVTFNGDTLTAQAGVNLKHLSELAYEHGLSGLEIFYDIPGTLGGAVCMNAGAGDECIGNLIEQVTCFDRNEKGFKAMTPETIGFGYRASWFLDRRDALIAEVRMSLRPADKDKIREKMTETQEKRRQKQPWDLPNAGSVFKRPPGRFVGQIIDQLNLKGTTVGGAQISTKHGGFIVNHNGQATGQDIVNLVRLVQNTVAEKLNITLELEQRVI